jgi:aspartate/methionine/tyrosine aminotransferase
MGKPQQSAREKISQPIRKIVKSTSKPLSESYAELLELRQAVAKAMSRSKTSSVRCAPE